MNKNDRHKIIKNVIQTNDIMSQEMLLGILLDNGMSVTQATLSRDIKELKIVKQHTETGSYKYSLSDTAFYLPKGETSLSAFGFISIEFSGHLVVIKTRPGYAMAIAGEIDNKAADTILGTVAGDDTILVIPSEKVNREQILESLASFIPNLKNRIN